MGWPPYPVPHPYHPVHLGAAHQLMGLSQVSIGQPSQIMQPGTAQTAGAATLGMLPAGLPGSIQGAERPPAAHGRVAVHEAVRRSLHTSRHGVDTVQRGRAHGTGQGRGRGRGRGQNTPEHTVRRLVYNPLGALEKAAQDCRQNTTALMQMGTHVVPVL